MPAELGVPTKMEYAVRCLSQGRISLQGGHEVGWGAMERYLRLLRVCRSSWLCGQLSEEPGDAGTCKCFLGQTDRWGGEGVSLGILMNTDEGQ